jgi:hypothetical protein
MIKNPFRMLTLSNEMLGKRSDISKICYDLHCYLIGLDIQNREMSIALTKLKECAMWANNALAEHE